MVHAPQQKAEAFRAGHVIAECNAAAAAEMGGSFEDADETRLMDALCADRTGRLRRRFCDVRERHVRKLCGQPSDFATMAPGGQGARCWREEAGLRGSAATAGHGASRRDIDRACQP